MKKITLAAVLLLSTATTAAAASDDAFKKLDAQLTSCTSNAQNTLATLNCYSVGSKSWDSELNKQYKLLLADQSEGFKSSMKQSQRAWITYRDAYITAMQNFYKQQEGTLWGITLSDAQLRVTRDRTIELYKLRTSTDLDG